LTNLLANRKVTDVAPVQGQQPPVDDAAQARIRALQDQLAQVETTQSRQLLFGSLIALAVMAVVSVVLGKLVASRVLRPLRMITATTRRISADNLHERLRATGPADEVRNLADTIDDLLGRLEASFAAQRRFVANASHELRTPFTTMRASLDVADAKPHQTAQTIALTGRLRTELDRVDRLLDGLLALARAQHGAIVRDHVTLDELTAAALDARAADIAAKGLTVHDNTGPAWTRGSEALLNRLVQNVIDNAIVHNEVGGTIDVATVSDDVWTRLVVESSGPVLDPAQVERLAEPFQRVGAERTGSESGSGLGLSIVAAIVEAHAGRLDLAARPEGGLRVTISLPLAAVPEGQPA